MILRTTHTCAILDLSPAAFAEIRGKLLDAGYQHAFNTDGESEWIDMSGIGVKPEAEAEPAT